MRRQWPWRGALTPESGHRGPPSGRQRGLTRQGVASAPGSPARDHLDRIWQPAQGKGQAQTQQDISPLCTYVGHTCTRLTVLSLNSTG